MAIHVGNFTKTAKRVWLRPPGKVKVFRIVKGGDVDGTLVAPGMDVGLVVEFVAPIPAAAAVSGGGGGGGKGGGRGAMGGGDDATLKVWKDVLGLEFEGEGKLEIPLEATPAGPRLQAVEEVNFGVVVAPKANGAGDRKAKLHETTAGWVTKQVVLTNVGPRPGRFVCSWDKYSPLRVQPSSGTLAATPKQAGGAMKGEDSRRLAMFESTASLTTSNTCTVQVSYLPRDVGPLDEILHIDVYHHTESQMGRKPIAAASSTPLSSIDIHLTGETVEHKLRLCTADGTRDLDPTNLNFGTVHYSRTARLRSKLENRGPTPIKWVITHAGESLPIVPPQLLTQSQSLLTQASDDIDSRASISVFPTEGTLAPYHSTPLTFTFAPRIIEPEKGFKSAQPPPPTRDYSVPMHLKIITSQTTNQTYPDVPLSLHLSGRACPVRALLSTRDIIFPDTRKGRSNEHILRLSNGGTELPFKFRFTLPAHFHVTPKSGRLQAGEEREVVVTFRPNQLGDMKGKIVCIVEAVDGEAGGGWVRVQRQDSNMSNEEADMAGLVDMVDSGHDVSRLHINVHGLCSPRAGQDGQSSPEPSTAGIFGSARISPPPRAALQHSSNTRSHRHLSDDGKESIYLPTTGPDTKMEWEQKRGHRQKYIDFLVMTRLDKLRELRTQRLGNDGVDADLRDFEMVEIAGRGRVDKESGLVEPEPVDCLMDFESGATTTMTSKNGVSAEMEDQKKISKAHSSMDKSALTQLFQRLIEFRPPSTTSVQNPQLMGTEPTITTAPLDTPLTGLDLSCIYCNTQHLSFQTITVHSTQSLPLSFLNATPTKRPIQITISVDAGDSKANSGAPEDKGHLEVSPTTLIVPPFSIAGVWVSFRGNVAKTYERKLSYLVNGRYRYRVPIVASVVPVDLEIGSEKVDVFVDTREVVQRGQEGAGEGSGDGGGRGELMVDMPSKSETIEVRNPGTSPAMFAFRVLEEEKGAESGASGGAGKQDGKGDKFGSGVGTTAATSPFTIHPESYTLAPLSSCSVTITYTPGVTASHEANVEMTVLDPSASEEDEAAGLTQTKQIKCTGSILPTAITLISGTKGAPLEFGNIGLGVDPANYGPDAHRWNRLLCASLFPPVTGSGQQQPPQSPGTNPTSPFVKVIKLKNTSQNPCVFTAAPVTSSSTESKSSSEVVISPSIALIPPTTTQDLSITILPTAESGGTTDAYLSVCPLGSGKTYRVHVRYNAFRPRVRVTTDGGDARMNMDGAVVGSFSTKNLGIVNDSPVTVRCVIDLRLHPDFSLAIGEGARSGAATAISSAAGERGTGGGVGGGAGKVEKSRSTYLGSGRSTKSGRGDAPDANALYASRVKRFRALGKGESGMLDVPSLVDEGVGAGGEGNLYVFDIIPNETFPLVLTYHPTTAQPSRFSMPIFVLGGENCVFLPVTATPTPTPLTISRRNVTFKPKVVHRDPAVSNMAVSHLTTPAKEVVWLTNETDGELEWWVDTDEVEESGDFFKVEPWRGTLGPRVGHPQQSQQYPRAGDPVPSHMAGITLTFTPPHTGTFTATLPLHTDSLGMRPSFHIQLVGKGVEPSIAFDPPEVFLPVAPPGWESSSVVSVINYGCERTEIGVEGAEGTGMSGASTTTTGGANAAKDTMPPGPLKDTKDATRNLPPPTTPHTSSLSLHYPEGKLLKSDGERLSFEIKLAPPPSATETTAVTSPINFTRKLAVTPSQSSQRAFYLPVHAMTEASLWTLLPFLWVQKGDVKLAVGNNGEVVAEKVGGVVVLDENQKRTRILTSPRPFRTPYGIALEGGPDHGAIEAFYTSTIETLSRWLDNYLGNAATAKNLYNQLILSNGRLLHDILQSLSGKRLGILVPSISPTASPEDRAKAARKLYSDLLAHLISIGALLSPIKPEFLLQFDDFKRVSQMRIDALKADQGYTFHDEDQEYIRKVEQHIGLIQKESWCLVLLQAVKVFAAQNVTVRQLRGMPGVDGNTGGEAELDLSAASMGGNLYGVCENVLLKWVGFHVSKMTGTATRFTNFTTDFKDSLAIAQLIESHLPEFGEERFEYMHQYPTTSSQLADNAKTLQGALTELFPNCTGITFPTSHLTSGDHPAEVLLLLLFLYQNLPGYLPRGTIEFRGTLHEKDTRYVELANPLSKSVWYTAEVEGSPEFSLETDHTSANNPTTATIQVPARSTVRVPIHFIGKFSRAVAGKLTLLSRRMGLNEGSVLVFLLNATVEPAPPRKLMKVEAPMYVTPPAVVNAEVVNPFPIKGTFKVELKQSRKLFKTGGANITEFGKQSTSQLTESVSYDTFTPEPFRITVTELELDANQSYILPVTFLPFDLGLHECTLHFSSDDVGEFSYQIEGRATPPHPSESITITTKSSSPVEKNIRIVPINPQRDKALHVALQGGNVSGKALGKGRGKEKEKEKEKEREKDKGGIVGVDKDAMQLPRKPLKYKVEYSSPYFQGPTELTVKPAVDLPKEKRHLMAFEQNYSELPVTFSPRNPGKYFCKITLTCLEASDVRVLVVNGVAISEGSKAELEFTTPARQPLTQDIPIVNKTDEDWTIKAHLQGTTFHTPQTLTARARTTTPIPITFRPTRPGPTHALLTLSNLQTSQKHTYHLHGVALDPLPEDTKEVTCNARDVVDLEFTVRNHNAERDVEFEVVSDLPGGEGEERVCVGRGGSEEYRMRVFGRCSGVWEGVVTFLNRGDGSYVWYVVKLTVNPPPPEDALSISTTVRKAVGVELQLSNPLDRPVTYTAEIEGEGLIGSKDIQLAAKEEKIYVLTYAPLLSSNTTGRIKFMNPDIGEFWYKLHLEAKEAPPIQLTAMECPLGKCTSQPLHLSNPLPHPVTITITLSNPRDFQIIYPAIPTTKLPTKRPGPNPPASQRITLEALSRPEVLLVYWPSSLTEVEGTKVECFSEEIGNEGFFVEGHGLLPTQMPTTHITSPISQTTTSSITFTNPLIDPIAATISLSQPEGTSDFALILHRRMGASSSVVAGGGLATAAAQQGTKIHVGGLESVDIPFSWTPEDMRGGNASVRVVLSKEVGWEFPIRGIPTHPPTTAPIPLETRVREPLTREVRLTLPDFVPEPSSVDDEIPESADLTNLIVAEVRKPNGGGSPLMTKKEEEEMQAVVESVVVSVREARWDVEEGCWVRVLLTYTPLTPHDNTLPLSLLYTPTHATYTFPLRLLAHPPSLDDTITIEGAIGKLSSVTFHLRNDAEHARRFKAYFTSGGEEFSVWPEEGVLESSRGEEGEEGGNRFVVGWRAGMYGRVVVGVLVVECPDISWSFEIRGVTPASRYPSASSGSSSQRKRIVAGAAARTDGPGGKRSSPSALGNTGRGVQYNRQVTRRRNFVNTNAMNPKVAAVESEM
ncbi:Cilia- and flagella-associated protein 47 [Rhizophlyctis rosea]|nr:Cilia- and flagella-associated protein 47 [Rhizophlyctis rosea]